MSTKQLPGGYCGKVLRVNLTDATTSVDEIDELFCRKYLGGAGFVAYYLWNELRQGVDPLGPENKLIFALGPVTGVSLPGSGRFCIGAKSPLTGGITKSGICSAIFPDTPLFCHNFATIIQPYAVIGLKKEL